MGKRLFLLAVVVEGTADAIAVEYTHKLGMHRIATRRHETRDGATDCVVMAGSDDPPYLAIFSGRGPASAVTHILDVYPPGLDRMVYLTDEYESDVAWLQRRGPVGESRITINGDGSLRHATALVHELGVVLDIIDEPSASLALRELVEPIVDSMTTSDRLATALVGVAARPRLAGDRAPTAVAKEVSKHEAGSLAEAQLDHVAIYVSDMASADELVRHGLGQEYVSDLAIPLKACTLNARTFRDPSPDPRTRFVITLCQSERGRVPDWIASHGSPGVHHLAHRVADLDDALEFARESGATQLSAVAEVDWLRQVMLRVTHDGFLHELIWRTDDRELDEANALRLIESQ